MASRANDPVIWRRRAAETRALAIQVRDQSSRTIILAVAARYERLANLIEDKSGARGDK